MLNVPLRPRPAQRMTVNLANQLCTIKVYQRSTGLYLDLYVDAALIVGGALCQHGNPLVRDGYLGFAGDLAFFDTQGAADPVYTGLGSRWVLNYLEPGELVR